jgi:type II secretory pathway predicted ATPase ExeA
MTVTTQNNPSLAWTLPPSRQATESERCERIYTDFFNLKGAPFSITPDPEFLFLSETHRSVFEKIQYGLEARMGFMLLTGEVGTGKTTLCRVLLDHLQGRMQTVYVINPSLSGQELLAGILDDLGVAYSAAAPKKELIDRLNRFLLADGTTQPVVIVVDDAQTMPLDALEDLRLLSNLETDKTKLLQMLLVGQPELLAHLEQPHMRQLKQRVAVNCRLDYLAGDEVAGYIERRLFIAGNQGQVRFAPKVYRRIHKQSGGVPRLINKICDLALTAAYAANSTVVECRHLKAAAGELIELQGLSGSRISRVRPSGRLRTLLIAAAAILAAMAAGFGARGLLERRLDLPGPVKAFGRAVAPAVRPAPDQAAVVEPSRSEPPPQAFVSPEVKAYILQLGSFNTLATTLRAVDIYAQKGMEVHWNGVQLGDKGLWYRVFAGRFGSIAAAREFQDNLGLAGTQVLYAPWGIGLDQAGPVGRIAAVRDRLQTQGVDSYTAPAQSGRLYLCAGAFLSQSRAQEMARRIHEQTGVATRVVNFHPALVSGGPGLGPAPAGDAS